MNVKKKRTMIVNSILAFVEVELSHTPLIRPYYVVDGTVEIDKNRSGGNEIKLCCRQTHNENQCDVIFLAVVVFLNHS